MLILNNTIYVSVYETYNSNKSLAGISIDKASAPFIFMSTPTKTDFGNITEICIYNIESTF